MADFGPINTHISIHTKFEKLCTDINTLIETANKTSHMDLNIRQIILQFINIINDVQGNLLRISPETTNKVRMFSHLLYPNLISGEFFYFDNRLGMILCLINLSMNGFISMKATKAVLVLLTELSPQYLSNIKFEAIDKIKDVTDTSFLSELIPEEPNDDFDLKLHDALCTLRSEKVNDVLIKKEVHSGLMNRYAYLKAFECPSPNENQKKRAASLTSLQKNIKYKFKRLDEDRDERDVVDETVEPDYDRISEFIDNQIDKLENYKEKHDIDFDEIDEAINNETLLDTCAELVNDNSKNDQSWCEPDSCNIEKSF